MIAPAIHGAPRAPRNALRHWAGAALLLPALALAADPFDTAALVGARSAPTACGELAIDHPLAVAEVVDLALCRNPRTAQAWAGARVQAAQLGVARAAYLPSLDADVSASHVTSDPVTPPQSSSYNQSSATLTGSYLLFDFGGRGATLESAKQSLAAADATLESTLQIVFLDAANAFYQVQAAEAALEAAQSAEEAARESFKAAEARYAVGAATPADKLQAQTAYSQATLNRITAQGDLRNAQGTLANVIGLDADQPLQLAGRDPSMPLEEFTRNVRELIDAARAQRPDLAAAEAQTRAAEANVAVARSAGKPNLSLSLSAGRSDRQHAATTDSSVVGLNLSVPLFAGFGPTYKIRAAQAQVESSAAQRDQLRLQVALDVWSAYQRLSTATQSLRTTDDLLASAQQSAEVAMGRYKAGVGSILDLLNAQSALAAARQQRIQAFFGWNTARITLAQSMGTLDHEALAARGPAAPSVPEQ